MNCCVNCFTDQALISLIGYLSTTKGKCDFCNSTEILIVKCEKLTTHFDQLFELYKSYKNAAHSIRPEPMLLHEHLSEYWQTLFNPQLLGAREIKHLVNQIGRSSTFYSIELFELPVEFSFLVDPAEMPAEDLRLKWDNFSQEIKAKNRFFVDAMVDMDTLDSIFSRLTSTYPTDSIFYRARISDRPLEVDQLGKPPASVTTSGRANPVGIPYLYVSDSERTTLYETRVSLHEGITIGKFISSAPINIVSLKNIMKFGPFEILNRGFSIEEFVQYRPYLVKLGDELSKPVRRQDANLDYLPTQFLCEFIKTKLGFDAVEYRSAMNPMGYNLAIFNDDKLKCIEANFYTVTDLQYIWESAL